MKRFDLITPEGTRDLLFGECAAVTAVENRLLDMFRARGYSEVVTPGLEFYDVFDLKSRYFPQESMYKLVDNKARLMVVRPDSTMPIARMTATRLRGEALPIRLCYCQSVYRNRPGMRGRSDEIRQTGIELIGSSSKRAEIEMLSNALEALSSFRTGGFRLELGHIGYFKALIDKIGCDQDTIENIRSLIEYKNYPALGDMLSEMGSSGAVQALKQLPKLFGGTEVFQKAAELAGDSEAAMNALKELRTVYEKLTALGYDGTITIDLGLVNRMDYYTGIVVKGYIEGCGDAVLSGGRYDRLLSEFGFDAPAIGFAVNADAVARTEMRLHDFSDTPADVIVFGEDGYEIKAIEHTKSLISSGLKAEYAVFDTKEETLRYAATKHIHRIDTVGETITEEHTNE
ncbi:MAG: ATP phosphoribosyltransferase regulatory subunit [Oscillospiraceae bacterium]|nr:ATP phosphoribosyltransferase regulatory subunit [Oscillospiraceae bacterium]